jgi:hypothetical protein
MSEKLEKFEQGLKRAFTEVIPEIVIPILISSFISTGLFPFYFILFFDLLSVGAMISLIQKMSYWATSYIIGWIVGIIILAPTGLLTIIDLLIYLILTPVGLLLCRFLKRRGIIKF